MPTAARTTPRTPARTTSRSTAASKRTTASTRTAAPKSAARSRVAAEEDEYAVIDQDGRPARRPSTARRVVVVPDPDDAAEDDLDEDLDADPEEDQSDDEVDEGPEMVQVAWRRLVFEVPADILDWPVAAIIALEEGKTAVAISSLLPPADWRRFLAAKPTGRDMRALGDTIAKAAGLTTQGE